MRSIIFTMTSVFMFFSCKKSESNESKTDNETESRIAQKKIYEGKGTFDSNGNVNYEAYLPREVLGKITVVSELRIDDETLFIQIQTPGNVDLLGRPDPVDQKINIKRINPSQFKKTINVHLWHDAKLITDIKEAKDTINSKCYNHFAPPERCGNGVLTFK
jgi:hypothetical protein